MNSNGFNLQKNMMTSIFLKKCLQLGYCWLKIWKRRRVGVTLVFDVSLLLKTWSFSGSGDHYKAQWNSFNCFSNKALPINTNCWRKKNIIQFQELFFFNSFSFTFFSIFGIFTVCNDLSKSNYFLPPRKHLSSDVEKVKRCVLAPFFGFSANDNNWKIFGDLLHRLCNKSGFYGYKRFFRCFLRSIETFFSHSCCTFDFHFRCYFLSLAIRKCVENYGVGKRRSLCIADMPEVNWWERK